MSDVNAKYLRDENNEIFSPINSPSSVILGGGQPLSNSLEYASLISLGSNVVYNLQGGYVKRIVNTTEYHAYPYNKFFVNNGDGQSIGVKKGVGTIHAKVEAYINMQSSIAREVYLGISINSANTDIYCESYATTTSECPYINLYVCNPFLTFTGGEKIRMYIYSNNPGNVTVQKAAGFPKLALIVTGIY